ncbi:hypothetical protein [Phreatobacter sp.]|uniref:hypothetical protein n=1 Tax=Phreatobacter sp. TaxID=1966341 RepID=UPI003F71263C
MKASALAILPILLAMAGAGDVRANPTEPGHRGRFELHYKPVPCFRPPCPGGTYVVSAAGRRILQGRRLVIDDRTSPREAAALRRLAPFISGAMVTGTVTLVPADGGTITVRPTAVHGRP